MSGFVKMVETAIPQIITKITGKSTEDLKKEAQGWYERFLALEQHAKYVSDERIALLETKLEMLAEHVGYVEPTEEEERRAPDLFLTDNQDKPEGGENAPGK